MKKHPNILFILSDQHCGYATGYAGDPNVKTPHMDRLAAEGAAFDTAFCNSPICTPSRGSIFSGRYPQNSPVPSFFQSWIAGAPSIANHLRDHGYHSAYFGKWHCGMVRDQHTMPKEGAPEKYNFAPLRAPERMRGGFQDWFAFEINNQPFDGNYYHQNETHPRAMQGYQSDWLTDLGCNYLGDYADEAPLFMVASIEPPHFPLDAPKDYLEKYPPSELVCDLPPESELRTQLAKYYAMVDNLDHNIGRLRAKIESLPRFKDNTLIIYLSDHGDFMGRHGRIGCKEFPHEESIRIPAIFHWPSAIPASGKIDGLFSLVDFMATTCGLAKLPIPGWNEGTDWAPKLLGGGIAEPETVYVEMFGSPRWNLGLVDWRAVRTSDYLYAVYENCSEQLFDLRKDPAQTTNIAETAPELRKQLRDTLRRELKRVGDRQWELILDYGRPPEGSSLDVATSPSQTPYLYPGL